MIVKGLPDFRSLKDFGSLVLIVVALACLAAPALSGQDKGPTDKVRSHPRLKKEMPEGQKYKLPIGTLFVPKGLKREGTVPLFIHFHGGDWLPEVAAVQHGRTAVVTVQLGTGSSAYGQPFADGKAFGQLLTAAEKKAGVKFGPITLTAWSAGYGAVRAILRNPADYERIEGVLLLDALHAGYVKDSNAKGTAKIIPQDIDIFVKLAKDAVAGKKRFIVTHTKIDPGAYASTTETADYLLHQLKLERKLEKKVGPMQTQQLSSVEAGRFLVLGFEGDTADDHVDLLHCLPDYLKRLHAVE
jgi:hypothetical protein